MPYLRFTTGDRLRLEGEEMPGIVESVEVEGETALTSLPREGQSGDVHVVRGHRDYRVRIRLRLLGKNPLQELKRLQGRFAKHKEKPLRVVHPHLAARGIEKALFVRLFSRDEGGVEGMEAVLELVQTESREAISEGNAQAQKSLGTSMQKGPVAGPPPGSPAAERNPKPAPKAPSWAADAFSKGFQAGYGAVGGR